MTKLKLRFMILVLDFIGEQTRDMELSNCVWQLKEDIQNKLQELS